MQIRSPGVIDALKAIRKHRGEIDAKQCTERILNPKTSMDANRVLGLLSGPPEDFDLNYAMAVEEFQVSQAKAVE